MKRFDRISLIGGILLLISLFLPFWAGVPLISGIYDMWVTAPSINYYGLPQFGPQVTVDIGWTTWLDVIMLTLAVVLIFIAGVIGIFKRMVGGVLGIIGFIMILFSFIGLSQLTYFWIWSLMGPAFFTLIAGALICLINPYRSKIRSGFLRGKRMLIFPIIAVLLISLLIASMHTQALASEEELKYFNENLENFLPGTSDENARRTFLTNLDIFIQSSYQELPKFVEYSSIVGHGLDWGNNYQEWSLNRLLKVQIQGVLDEIEHTTIDSGVIVWRIYNEGFIVKTSSITVGFDIACSWLCSEIAEIADHVDILFVSHRHGDHADVEVLTRAIRQGVKIVVPEPDLETAWYVKQLPSDAVSQLIPVSEGKTINVSGVKIRAFLGTHSVPNYAYLVEFPEELILFHTGDTEHFSEAKWDKLSQEQEIDIAFITINSLADIPKEVIKIPILVQRQQKMPLGRPFSEIDLQPKIIIPMHENEIAHGLAVISTTNLRLAYQQSDELNTQMTQVVVLAWGQKMFLEM